jgi:hypothetical protein
MMLGMINAAAQQVNSCPGHVRARLHRGDEPQCAAASYWRGIIVIEDQESVSAWADQTFGPASSNARVAAVLSRLMTRMGRNPGEEERARWRSIAGGSEVSRPTAATATTSATR